MIKKQHMKKIISQLIDDFHEKKKPSNKGGQVYD
jgi:hypothetical protein